MRLRVSIALCLAAALATAACEDMFPGSRGTVANRNYGEIVDRMVNAMKGRSPEDAAANLFNVTSPDERRDAIAWLETKPWGHDEPYMKAYQVLSTDPHPMVRAQAMEALGHSYKPDEAVSYLLKGLDYKDKDDKEKDVQVRRDASYGLMFTWNDSAFAPLLDHLKEDPDEVVRGNCARALAHAQGSDAVRGLIDALKDRDAGVTKFAHDSLVATTGRNLWYSQHDWLAWYQETYLAPTTQSTTKPG